MYVDKKDMLPCIAAYCNARQYEVIVGSTVHLSGGYWSGGSKNGYAGIELATGRILSCSGVEFGNPFTHPDEPICQIPPGFAVIQTTIFQGKHMPPTIYIHPDNAAKLLPSTEDSNLTDDMLIVLKYTKTLKSSYGGIRNYRFHEAHERTGITLQRWEFAKSDCIKAGYLNRAGAITSKGRNAIT